MAEPNRLPSGKRSSNALYLFSKRARTWILTVSAAAIICFLLIPFFLDRISSANTAFVRAAALAEATPVPTAVPTSLAVMEEPVDPASLTPAQTENVHISRYSLLQENDDFPAVQNLQLRLMDLGYLDSDEPTTVYGASTAVAVSLFQRTIQDTVTGVADVALQEHLFSDAAEPYEMKLGDSGADVRSMQSRLNELGYYESKINGFFGATTEDAVRAFQKKNGLEVSGIFSVNDRDVLFSPSAKPKIDPTPTPSPTPKPTRKPTPKPTKRPSATGGGSSSDSSSGDSGGSSSGDSGDSSSGGGSYNASHSASGLISVADAQRGKPYKWSEEGPDSFDCSGLVYFCLRTCGVSTSRYSAAGFSEVSKWSRISSISELERGDLLFFRNDSSSRISHTGIYIGSGKFVHASSSSGKVIVSSVGTSYWTRNFMLARRVF